MGVFQNDPDFRGTMCPPARDRERSPRVSKLGLPIGFAVEREAGGIGHLFKNVPFDK